LLFVECKVIKITEMVALLLMFFMVFRNQFRA